MFDVGAALGVVGQVVGTLVGLGGSGQSPSGGMTELVETPPVSEEKREKGKRDIEDPNVRKPSNIQDGVQIAASGTPPTNQVDGCGGNKLSGPNSPIHSMADTPDGKVESVTMASERIDLMRSINVQRGIQYEIGMNPLRDNPERWAEAQSRVLGYMDPNVRGKLDVGNLSTRLGTSNVLSEADQSKAVEIVKGHQGTHLHTKDGVPAVDGELLKKLENQFGPGKAEHIAGFMVPPTDGTSNDMLFVHVAKQPGSKEGVSNDGVWVEDNRGNMFALKNDGSMIVTNSEGQRTTYDAAGNMTSQTRVVRPGPML